MADLVFVLLAFGLFAASAAYVRGCARLIGDARAERVDEERAR